MAKLTISADTISRAVTQLQSIDLAKAWDMLESGDFEADLEVGAEAAGLVANFVPVAGEVEAGIKLLIFIDQLRQAGVWAPAEPTDPAMIHAEGRTGGGGTPEMHASPVIAPDGSPTDPYAFDKH